MYSIVKSMDSMDSIDEIGVSMASRMEGVGGGYKLLWFYVGFGVCFVDCPYWRPELGVLYSIRIGVPNGVPNWGVQN